MISGENIYWAYSSAAQTVAAFVALLLAGYAIVLTMMESAVQADETLTEIYESLKKRYHKQLSILAISTAIAIIGCLFVVYLNEQLYWWLPLLEVIAAIFTCGSIIGGVYFVITIIDPGKYRKAAQKLSMEVRPQPESVNPEPSATFFLNFVEIERLIRDLWEKRAKQKRVGRRQGPPSFREMLEALSMAEVLPFKLYERLLLVNRYRNLIFHGHVQEVDEKIVEEVSLVRKELDKLKKGKR